MRTQDILPVLISILIIITIAVVQRHSKYMAAITATMPLNVALGYWVVAASTSASAAASAAASVGGEQKALTDFSSGMLLSILPTMGFLLVLWLASRAGAKPLPALGLGYAAWALGTLVIMFLRRLFLGGA